MIQQQFSGLKQATQQLSVYGGPNSNNANIGTIFNQEVVTFLDTERGYAYIEYSTTYGAKRGYVLNSALQNATPPTLPNLTTYSNFTSGVYGTSGLGQNLKYYKIGNGSNVAFAVFAQHGWEDAWAYDGIELVNIADRVMSYLSTNGIDSNWTLYIIPYANPDGITNGYTNNGPGRCTVTTQIDMNRSWPANFVEFTTSRNYTGSSALGSPEGVALKNFIENNIGNNQKIILDIHGWLNQTYGDYSIAQYFDGLFGYGNSPTYGSGYLETWGKSIGARSCLIELPMPTSSSDIISRDFSGKLALGIKNMLAGAPAPENGTEVYEAVQVVSANIDLNVRSGPGTSYSVIATLPNGTVVTRIRKDVATSNGLVWDKIRLNNGVEGYVATNYLVLYYGEQDYTIGDHIYTKYKADSNIASYNQQKIIDGENEFASMDLVELYEQLPALDDIKLRLGLLIGVGKLFTNASRSLQNYYDITGEHIHHSNTEDMVYACNPVEAMITIIQLESVIMAETMNNNNQQFIFSLKEEEGISTGEATFNSILPSLFSEGPGDLIDHYNWVLTYGSTRIAVTSNVEYIGNKTKMTTTYTMKDYYDWDPGKTGLMFGYISENELWQLNKAGMAKNFHQDGSYIRVLEWTTGSANDVRLVSEFSR